MSLNFGFKVGVRSGHHRHPNTVIAAELLQECIHFWGQSVYIYIYMNKARTMDHLKQEQVWSFKINFKLSISPFSL